MTQRADRGPCNVEGCDRESRTVKPGPCKRCYDLSRAPLMERSPSFPAAPLIDFAARRGISLRDLSRATNLSLEKADALCIDVLGVHPFDVYGNDYFA